MLFCKTVIVGIIILAVSCFQANAQGRSAQTLAEVLQAFIESKQGKKLLAAPAYGERWARANLSATPFPPRANSAAW